MSTPPTPEGWYPDPQGPPGQQRWWTGSLWSEHTRPAGAASRPPAPTAPTARSSSFQIGGSGRSWALIAAAVVLVLLYFNGSLDEPLSNVGLNSKRCAENLFGNKMCGEELTNFCKQSYDPDVNAETCDEVLRDAGIDPASIVAEQKKKDDADAAAIVEDSASEDASFSDATIARDVHGVVVAVERCFKSTGDYTRCEREDDLGFVSAIIGDRTGEVQVRASSSTSYAVIGHSESGADFSYVRDENGEEYSCTTPGKGRCGDDGTWTPAA